MFTKVTAVLGIILAGFFQTGESFAIPQTESAETQQKRIYLHETFDGFDVGSVPKVSQLQRSDKVTVVDGAGRTGSGKVAHFDDSDTELGGAMEYVVGTSGVGALYVEFDAINNAPGKGDKSSAVIFAVGPWGEGKSLMLNSKAKRAFGFEMYQQKYLKLRVGDDSVADFKYDSSAPFNVKIWVNDHDSNTLSYKRPDNGEAVTLNPDSVVVWVNNALFGKLSAAGSPMQSEVTKGDAVLGRVGYSSSSTKVADFLFDNLHVEDPSGESKPAAKNPATEEDKAKTKNSNEEVTPQRLPGAETMSYREGENAMNLFVFKPDGWKADDKRSAFVYFFGGGWTKGTPQKSASMAAWAAKNGMVGIAPDYRTKSRFGTSPLASAVDAREAFGWVVEHADELGIDPTRVAVGGTSAGGHVALWTAIENDPAGFDPTKSTDAKPAVLFLKSAVSDTSPETGYTPSRFGNKALALSPVHQVEGKMPPTLIFHAANDELVHYSTAVALCTKLKSLGSACDLVTVPLGGHGFSSEHPEWKSKVLTKLEQVFKREGLFPSVR